MKVKNAPKLHFVIESPDGGMVTHVPTAYSFTNSLFGESTGYFDPAFGEIGDSAIAITEDGITLAKFWIVRKEDYRP